MYRIYGIQEDSESEYKAAESIIEAAREYYGTDLDKRPEIRLDIIVGAKALGEKRPDLDLVVFFIDSRPNRQPQDPHSFLCLVEVKDHSKGVRFEGERVFVRYAEGREHNVSEQSFQQQFSLINHISKQTKGKLRPPFTTHAIFLRNLPSEQIPKKEGLNVIGRGFLWRQLSNIVLMLMDRPEGLRKQYEFKNRDISRHSLIFNNVNQYNEYLNVFSEEVLISDLDRKKLEQITKKILDQDSQKYAQKLGQQLLIYRGRGGSGKTINLLRLGLQAYNEFHLRVLFLSYNRSLLADLRRLFVHAGVSNSSGGNGFAASTLHSFFADWMRFVDETCHPFISTRRMDEDWDSLVVEFTELLKTGKLTDSEANDLKSIYPKDLDWDLVIIDESQDCAEREKYWIYKLYGPNRCVIADGIDQLVRGHARTDWFAGAPSRQVVTLSKSLRLKTNLCEGVSSIANAIGYEGWDVSPQGEAYGGQILVIFGHLDRDKLASSVVQKLKSTGNAPVDLLVCAPMSRPYVEFFGEVKKKGEPTRRSLMANAFEKEGLEVWDAVDETVRDSGARNTETVRIVPYTSCRGLEGWIVVAEALDVFYEKIHAEASKEVSSMKDDLYQSDEQWIRDVVNRWLMIPLTRAIDSLIIHVENESSEIGSVLSRLIEAHPETFHKYDPDEF